MSQQSKRSNLINFTKNFIENAELPEKGKRRYYRDTQIKGLILDVTPTGTKTFRVYGKVNGKPIRPTIGKYSTQLSHHEARRCAKKLLAQMVDGINPIAQKKQQYDTQITLLTAFNCMLQTRTYKAGTVKDYSRSIHVTFKDWQNQPLKMITRDKIVQRYKQLSQTAPTRANNAMRVLRAVFNFANGEYESESGQGLFPDNPVLKLNHLRAWNPNRRRQTIIQQHQLKAWFCAVQKNDDQLNTLKGSTTRDYLIFVLLTGLRRTEAASLKWTCVDLQGKSLVIHNTKNHDAFRLPLSEGLQTILKRRKQLCGQHAYVFPSPLKANMHLVEPKYTINKIKKASGVQFALHDLRRTFMTIAESLDISTIALKRLVNHRVDYNDVTSGYVIHDVERLREPMQRITDFILKMAEVKGLE